VEQLRNAHFVVAYEPSSRHFRVTRSSVPFATIDEMRERFLEVIGVLDKIGRAGANLLIDTTAAPARNDPEFELAFDPIRVRLLAGFRRAAVLVKTTVGRLQADRHQRQDKTGAQTFSDIALAEAFCAERDSNPPTSLRRSVPDH
jgi:hypothetical protein